MKRVDGKLCIYFFSSFIQAKRSKNILLDFTGDVCIKLFKKSFEAINFLPTLMEDLGDYYVIN